VIWVLAFAVIGVMTAAIFFGVDADPQRTGDAPTPATTDAGADDRPVLLVFGAGSFAIGEADPPGDAVAAAEGRGFEAHSLAYPLADLRAAVRGARGVALRYRAAGRPVYAYGESGGGTLAALLAVHGEVDAAATYSQVTDMVRFARGAGDGGEYEALIDADEQLLASISPGRFECEAPVLALAPEDDPSSPPTLRWDAREPQVHGRRVAGGHLGDPGDPAVYETNLSSALQWLQRQSAAQQPAT